MSYSATLQRGPGGVRTSRAPVRSSRRRRDAIAAYLLMAPAVLLTLGLLAYPMLLELWVSLTNRSAQNPATTYIGLSNYLRLLADPAFWAAVKFTTAYIAVTILLKLAYGLTLALSLARPFRGRPAVIMVACFPWVYPAGIGLIGWSRLAMPQVHTAYSILVTHLGASVDVWLGTGAWGMLTLVAFDVWRGGSFTGIVLVAALAAIPQELFDASALEARGGWQRFWTATLPLLRPYLGLATVLSLTTGAVDLGNVWFFSGQRDAYPLAWNQSFHHALIGGQWGMASALSLVLVPLFFVAFLPCARLIAPLEEPA